MKAINGISGIGTIIAPAKQTQSRSFPFFSPSRVYLNLKDRIISPSAATLKLRAIADDISRFDESREALVDAFINHFDVALIAKIFNQLTDTQLDSILKDLFRAAVDDPLPLIRKLMRLFTLQKIEGIIQTSFPRFNSTAAVVTAVANQSKRFHDAHSIHHHHTLKRTAYLYFTNTLDFAINTLLYVFNFKEAESDFQQEEAWQAKERYVNFRNNLAMVSGWFIALTIFCRNILVAGMVAGSIGTVFASVCYVYFRWVKECPSQVPPAINLVDQAIKGELAPVIGRDTEIQELIDALIRNQGSLRKHPILLGKTGAGKTEIVKGLAYRIATGQVSDKLKNKKIFWINTAQLISNHIFGNMYVLDRMLEKIKGHEDDAIFFFDEIHAVFMSEDSKVLSQVLKTKLDPSSKGLKYCITATTEKEFGKFMASDEAFLRRLEPIYINQTKDSATDAILSDMLVTEAPDIQIAPLVRTRIANAKTHHECFRDCPQPALSKGILARAVAKVRQTDDPDLKRRYSELIDQRTQLEAAYRLAYNADAFGYTEASQASYHRLLEINEQIAQVEKAQQEFNKKNHRYLELVQRRLQLKNQLEIIAIQEQSAKSPWSQAAAVRFILRSHYLQEALSTLIDEMPSRIITSDLVDQIIDEEKARMVAKNIVEE